MMVVMVVVVMVVVVVVFRKKVFLVSCRSTEVCLIKEVNDDWLQSRLLWNESREGRKNRKRVPTRHVEEYPTSSPLPEYRRSLC